MNPSYQSRLNFLLEKESLTKIFFGLTAIKILVTWILSAVVSFFDETLLFTPIDNKPPFVVFCATVLFAPFFETFIFQYGVFAIGERYKVHTNWLVVISTILFGFSHYYNLAYIFATLISGLFYAYFFAKIKWRGSTFIAYLFISLIHACNNLFGWCIMMIQQWPE